MKMFVWADAYHVSYGSAVAVAIAETVEQARAQLKGRVDISEYGFEPGAKGGIVENLDHEPDWVLDAPGGVIFQWQE